MDPMIVTARQRNALRCIDAALRALGRPALDAISTEDVRYLAVVPDSTSQYPYVVTVPALEAVAVALLGAAGLAAADVPGLENPYRDLRAERNAKAEADAAELARRRAAGELPPAVSPMPDEATIRAGDQARAAARRAVVDHRWPR